MNAIETHILEIIGENTTSPDVFTDDSVGMAQIRDSVNDAIEEMTMLTGAIKRSYYLMMVAGQNFYRLDFRKDQFGWVTDAWLHGIKRRMERRDLIWMNSFNPRWLLNTGTPEVYMQIGSDVVGIWPTPSGSDQILELTCAIMPGRYTEGTDRIRLRDDFQWAAVHFSVGEYYASRGDAQQAIYHHNLYVEKLGIQSLFPAQAERKWSYRTDKGKTA